MNRLNAMLVRIGCGVIQDPYPPPPPRLSVHWKSRMVPLRNFQESWERIEQFKHDRRSWYTAPVIQQPSNAKSRLIRVGLGMLAYTEKSPELVEQDRAERNQK